MLEAGWNGTSGQRAVDYREDAGTGYVKDIFQESSGDYVKGAGCRCHGRNNLYEGG